MRLIFQRESFVARVKNHGGGSARNNNGLASLVIANENEVRITRDNAVPSKEQCAGLDFCVTCHMEGSSQPVGGSGDDV